VVVRESKRIGIEQTLVLVDGGKRRGSIKSRESAKDKITCLAEEFFQEYEPREVYVSLFFNPGCELRKREEKDIARAVAETVSRNLPPEGRYCWVKYRLGSGQPIEVDLISIFRTTNFGNEHWGWQEAGEVHRNAIDYIQRRIEAKARTIRTCLSKCDECWLLVVAPSRTPAGFIYPDDFSLRYTYNSAFARSWFLDDSSGETVRLNTAPAEIRDI
jgi:hypothetical protein